MCKDSELSVRQRQTVFLSELLIEWLSKCANKTAYKQTFCIGISIEEH